MQKLLKPGPKRSRRWKEIGLIYLATTPIILLGLVIFSILDFEDKLTRLIINGLTMWMYFVTFSITAKLSKVTTKPNTKTGAFCRGGKGETKVIKKKLVKRGTTKIVKISAK